MNSVRDGAFLVNFYEFTVIAPEPGSLALLALGALPIAGVAAARRRRHTRN